MRFEQTQNLIQKVIKQRNFSYVMSCGLLGANLLLVIKFIAQEEQWILVPQFNVEHKVSVSRSVLSEPYLIDWAGGITRQLLTVNASNVDRSIEDVLNITSSGGYGALKEKFKKDAKKLKEDNVSTVFYPKEFTVDQSRKQVKVTGQFLCYFGYDKAPITTEKTYVLEWRVIQYGFLCLHTFKENTDE